MPRDLSIRMALLLEPKNMKDNQHPTSEFQELLDKHHQIEGQLAQVEGRLEQKQVQYLSGICSEGNYLLGWHHRSDLTPCKKPLDISPKDKRFSLSSVYSRPSLELLNIEDRRLTLASKGSFQKKKKHKKGKGKTTKIVKRRDHSHSRRKK